MKKRIVIKSDTALCALEECRQPFKKGSHNAKYCSSEHAKIATNRRILQRYHERKRMRNTKRVCATPDCGTILSAYNRTPYCSACAEKEGLY